MTNNREVATEGKQAKEVKGLYKLRIASLRICIFFAMLCSLKRVSTCSPGEWSIDTSRRNVARLCLWEAYRCVLYFLKKSSNALSVGDAYVYEALLC